MGICNVGCKSGIFLSVICFCFFGLRFVSGIVSFYDFIRGLKKINNGSRGGK